MTNKAPWVLAFAATVGLTGSAFAQGNSYSSSAPAATNTEPDRVIVAERVISQNPTVIERQVVVGRIMHMPDRNPGISRAGGTVGGAIGGYYIVGTTPASNVPLDIPPDAYAR